MADKAHLDLTFAIRGEIFETRNQMKAGWSEKVYHAALVHQLKKKGFDVASKPRRPLIHRGFEVHTFEPDIVVENSVILELKALEQETEFAGAHYFQLINYLKNFEIRVGYLVNFAPAKVAIERVIWDEPPFKLVEHTDNLKLNLNESGRACLEHICQTILAVAHHYNLGYHETIYRNIIALEMEHNGMTCTYPVDVLAKWGKDIIASDKVEQLLVAERCLIHVRSLLPKPTTLDFTRTKTYLESLGLAFGLVINFGRQELQIYGVTPD